MTKGGGCDVRAVYCLEVLERGYRELDWVGVGCWVGDLVVVGGEEKMMVAKIEKMIKQYGDILDTANGVCIDENGIMAEWRFLLPREESPFGFTRTFEVEWVVYDDGKEMLTVHSKLFSTLAQMKDGVVEFQDISGYYILLDLKSGKIIIRGDEDEENKG
jgi:hypothetical protein